jgi:hypothetical protein
MFTAIRRASSIAGEPASLYSADVQIREPQMTWGARASDQEFVEMSEKIEMISRREHFPFSD